MDNSVVIGNAQLIRGDALSGMRELDSNSFDLAILDPPYGASSEASWSLPSDHKLDGFGGEWKLADHVWDDLTGLDSFKFIVNTLLEVKRLVRPTGSVWIHGTYHNAGFVNVACQLLGLEIINEVIWYKRNAFPNLSGRRLTASHESLYWVHTGEDKREYFFNYEGVKAARFPEDRLKNPEKQLRTVWDIPSNKTPEEREFGTHPTQKPLRVTDRILLATGIRGGRLLVPFLGSGTELVAGLRSGMAVVGFETDESYFQLACNRARAALENSETQLKLDL